MHLGSFNLSVDVSYQRSEGVTRFVQIGIVSGFKKSAGVVVEVAVVVVVIRRPKEPQSSAYELLASRLLPLLTTYSS